MGADKSPAMIEKAKTDFPISWTPNEQDKLDFEGQLSEEVKAAYPRQADGNVGKKYFFLPPILCIIEGAFYLKETANDKKHKRQSYAE